MATNGSVDKVQGPTTRHICTTYSSRSLLTKVLQPCLRPLRPHLVKPGKPQNVGSIQLSPLRKSCSIAERTVAGIRLYDFTPPPFTAHEQHKKPSHVLLYFAGGGFQSPPSKEHWRLCEALCLELWDSHAVSIVSYPLAPSSPASDSLSALRGMLAAVVNDARDHRGSVTLVGDSAGGNVALSLAFTYAKGQAEGENSVPGVLGNVLVISPPTDLRNTNAAIKEADRHDPILSVGLIESVAVAWAGSMPREAPEVSPLLDDFSAIKKTRIKIHGVVGTYDVLAPDALLFRDKCEREEIPGEWMIWEGQMHCFPLAACYGLSEGKVARDWIVDVLKRNM